MKNNPAQMSLGNIRSSSAPERKPNRKRRKVAGFTVPTRKESERIERSTGPSLTNYNRKK